MVRRRRRRGLCRSDVDADGLRLAWSSDAWGTNIGMARWCSPLDPPALDELVRRFAASGYELRVRRIGIGRYLASADDPTSDRVGPVAMDDTPSGAARRAWSRFERNREHFSAPLGLDNASVAAGASLRRLREARGLSQRRLATIAHVSVTTISRLERDRRAIPTSPTRAAIAGALGAPVGDLFPGLD